MATIVASRYAILSVDDDEDLSSKKKKVPNKKAPDVKPQSASSVKSYSNPRKKKKQEVTQPQTSKNPKPNSGNVSKKKKQPVSEQWEEWKQKDSELVQGNFEEDLSRAIFLSKLDYEQKKEYYESIKKTEKAKKPNSKKNKNKNQKIMSLNEFNNLGSQNSKKDSAEKLKTEEFKEPEFFSKIDDQIKNELSKEHLLDLKRAKDLNSQESLTLVLYKACIEKRDREIEQLKKEVDRLSSELKNVKIRNTKLCQVIANGEMKDKAEVLMEVERLQTIKDELSSEVANLHIQLEQERSKVRQLTGEHKNREKVSSYVTRNSSAKCLSKKHHYNSVDSQ